MLSRRGVLKAGSLAVANVAATPTRIIFGANRSVFDQVNARIRRAIGVRTYYDGENHFPVAWPGRLPNAWMTLSLRPNPRDLLSGELNVALRQIIDSAPAHSELTFWHENTSGNPLGYPSYVNNPRTAVNMQHYGHWLCRGTNVRFGVITCGIAVQQHDWVARGLDWYGDDLYAFERLESENVRPLREDEIGTLSRAKLFARLDSNLAFWRSKSGLRWPAIRITETNSPFDSQRKNWFTWLAQWMAGHNGRRILTYWNPDHGAGQSGLSGPWPPSATVVQRLYSLAQTYR